MLFIPDLIQIINMEIRVENIKCNGCATSVRDKLMKLNGVTAVEVDVANGIVKVGGLDDGRRAEAIAALASMGYTEPGAGNVLDAAKSYVSCMIGRINS
jgi:copper chaperone